MFSCLKWISKSRLVNVKYYHNFWFLIFTILFSISSKTVFLGHCCLYRIQRWVSKLVFLEQMMTPLNSSFHTLCFAFSSCIILLWTMPFQTALGSLCALFFLLYSEVSFKVSRSWTNDDETFWIILSYLVLCVLFLNHPFVGHAILNNAMVLADDEQRCLLGHRTGSPECAKYHIRLVKEWPEQIIIPHPIMRCYLSSWEEEHCSVIESRRAIQMIDNEPSWNQTCLNVAC